MSTDNPVVEPADTFYNKPAEAEPTEPTAKPVTEAEPQDSPQEEKALDKPEEVEAKADAETEELEAEDENKESQYIELDGKEIDLEDVRKWRDSTMMQSDYTKKTTALAEERKTFEAERTTEREQLLKSQTEVSELRDQLTALTIEDEEIDWAELKEDDPDRYIELKEQADKRKELLEKIKAERETPVDDPAVIQVEQEKLMKSDPEWLDKDGKATEVFANDMRLVEGYAAKAGFTQEEFSRMNRAHYMLALLKAAKYDQLQESSREVKKTREKVPVVTKPKATKPSHEPKAAHEVFYGT
jgi:hypothetical protein